MRRASNYTERVEGCGKGWLQIEGQGARPMESTRALKLANAIQSAHAPTRDIVEFEMLSCASSISPLRSRVRAFAHSMGFTADELDEICIAVGEASTNVVKHGRSTANPDIGVRMENRAGALVVCVTDSGPGFDPSAVCPPSEGDLCECGRGILCMRLLMDEVIFRPLDPGMCVELVKYTKTTVSRGL
jgi:serine/threonine-protein kinase RsbW